MMINLMGKSISFFLIFLYTACFSKSQEVDYKHRISATSYPDGRDFTIYTNRSLDNLSPLLNSNFFGNSILNVCGGRGPVIGYLNFYNNYYFSGYNNGYCAGLYATIRSIRFIGDTEDFTKPTLNFFENDILGGTLGTFYENQTSIQSPSKSLVATGFLPFNFTLYSEENYGGSSYCIQYPDGGYERYGGQICNFTRTFGHSDIKSFHWGCNPKQKSIFVANFCYDDENHNITLIKEDESSVKFREFTPQLEFYNESGTFKVWTTKDIRNLEGVMSPSFLGTHFHEVCMKGQVCLYKEKDFKNLTTCSFCSDFCCIEGSALEPVLSTRFFGNISNFTMPSVNLFTEFSLQGLNTTFYESTLSINLTTNSILMTGGYDREFSFYAGPNYELPGMCVSYEEPSLGSAILDVEQVFGFNLIGSMHIGCNEKLDRIWATI